MAWKKWYDQATPEQRDAQAKDAGRACSSAWPSARTKWLLKKSTTSLAREPDGDSVAVAKRALRAGETLDGEGGYTVWGKLVPAERSLAAGALPIGLAHNVALIRDIAAGEIVRWADVTVPDSEAVRVRRDMERCFGTPPAAIAAQ